VTVVGLFGGSFDPPHLAHQMVCLFALETAGVDAVWMVPTYRHPFAKEMVAFDHRLAMCELAAAPFGGRVIVSDIERELDAAASRTLDTVVALRARHPDVELRLIIGSDILRDRHKWHRWDEVERLAPPIVVPRAGHDDAGAAVTLPDVSSTEVRERLARGDSAVPLVSRAVMDYIARQGLYR
jgi:nicotinate-nucleotide adenylyltransferase